MIFSRAAANCLAHSILDMLASYLDKAAPQIPWESLHHNSPEDSLVWQDYYLYSFVLLNSLLLVSLEDGSHWGWLPCDGLTFSVCQVALCHSNWQHWLRHGHHYFFKSLEWVPGWYFSQGPGSHVSGNLSEQIIQLYWHKWHTFACLLAKTNM